MRFLPVVIVDIPFQAFVKVFPVVHWVQVNVPSFKSSPKSFYVNIIQATAFSVHANDYMTVIKIFTPGFTSELRSLVGVYDLRLSMGGDGFMQNVRSGLDAS